MNVELNFIIKKTFPINVSNGKKINFTLVQKNSLSAFLCLFQILCLSGSAAHTLSDLRYHVALY